MLLQKETCQKIVDRFTNILDTNINVIDLEGKIIASTNKNRVNNFHQGALSCVLSQNELIITKNNQHLYKGCEPGINLPIYYNNEIIGVVGITGDPEQIKGYALVVKELVELIVVESEQRKKIALKEEIKRSFFTQLFSESGTFSEESLKSSAHIAGFNFKCPKRIVFLAITSLQTQKNEGRSFENQKLKTTLKTYLAAKLHLSENVIDLYEDEIILVLDDSPHLSSFLQSILKDLEQGRQIKVRFYVSEICHFLTDFAISYKRTKILIGLYKNKETTKNILQTGDYKLELLLNALGKDEKEHYLSTFSRVFEETAHGQIDYDLLETVLVYFECHMSSIEAAQKMHLHRNTIRYRINKLKELYDIDITKPYECMQFYLAIKLFLNT